MRILPPRSNFPFTTAQPSSRESYSIHAVYKAIFRPSKELLSAVEEIPGSEQNESATQRGIHAAPFFWSMLPGARLTLTNAHLDHIQSVLTGSEVVYMIRQAIKASMEQFEKHLQAMLLTIYGLPKGPWMHYRGSGSASVFRTKTKTCHNFAVSQTNDLKTYTYVREIWK